MEKYILKKQIFAFLFIIVVFGFAAFNFLHSFEPLKEVITTSDELQVADIDGVITNDLYGKMEFIEAYSYVQLLLDKREYNNFNVIKDENGFLQYASFFREQDTKIFDYALRVKRLQDYANANGTEVLFVVTPSKYDYKNTVLREGLSVNDPSSTVNELMFDLNRLGVKTLNLSETMPNNEMPYEDIFFRTDHHWTVPAAFYATGTIVDTFKDEFGLDLDPDGYYMDINNYQEETYYGGMLGSMGRRTGAVFSGVDDFTALWPRFEGDFYRQSMLNDGKLIEDSGSFEKVLMNEDALLGKDDIYSGSQYSLYLNELRIFEKIINSNNPDGCKMFMIRDSYFSPVIAFMMPMCGEIDAIWSLEESDKLDIENYIKNNQFDYIVIEVYPYNIDDAAFNYFKGDNN